MTAFLRLLQIDELTWSTVRFQELPGRVVTVLFAFGILTWNRFGALTVFAPRAATRLMLIGIYGWLAISALIWVAGKRGMIDEPPRFREAAIASSIAHTPLVALGFFMAIVAGFARVLGPGAVLAVAVFGLWMPALLTRAFRDVGGLTWRSAAAVAVLVQLLWLATLGLYFHEQVGHLL